MDQRIEELARQFWHAEEQRVPIDPVSVTHPDFSTSQAYSVQRAVAAIRIAGGQRSSGWKIGLTSKAVRDMVGLDEPDYGRLFHEARITAGDGVVVAELIQPKIEPELAFVFGRNLAGPDVGPSEVLDAADHVTGAFEIVDCRIRDWRVRGIDAICDNGSAARFVLGETRIAASDNLREITVEFRHNDDLAAVASMAEVMGDPVLSICWLANKLATQGEAIAAGDVVLAGAPCRPVDMRSGDVFEATFSRLDSIKINCL